MGAYGHTTFYDDRPKSDIEYNPERHSIISIDPFVVEKSRQLSLSDVAKHLDVSLTEELINACNTYKEEDDVRLATERMRKMYLLIQ